MSCCGKVICCGCTHAPVYDNEGNVIREKTCPFCRTPFAYSDEETIKRLEKRMELNDPRAIYNMGCHYGRGDQGLPQSYAKALELWHRAAELGSAEAYHNIGIAYRIGRGVERDEKKAEHYYELAAMGGIVTARHNLGVVEGNKGNMDRALKHWMIAVKGGDYNSLKNIEILASGGDATKDDYANALRSYQAYLEEIRSDQRDKAAAFRDVYKYYETGF